MKTMKIFSLCCCLLVSSCIFKKTNFSLAQKFLTKNNCKKAYLFFQQLEPKTKAHKTFALQATKKCTDSKITFLFYESLLHESLKQDSFLTLKETKNIQFKLAQIAFYDLKMYRTAIKYYKESLKFALNPKQKFIRQYKIAQSFFLIHKYDQCLFEIKKMSFKDIPLELKQKALILKGRTFISQKNFKKAIPLFQQLIQKDPKKAALFREYLVLIYEEKKDFRSAIQEIQKIDPPNNFTREKTKYFYERLKNQPGSRL